MGVGKYTPNHAVAGDMGWKPPYVKQWTNIFRHWSRCTKIENNRINYKVFKWSIRKGSYKIKNWSYQVMEMLKCYNMERFCNINQYILDKNTIYHLEQEMFTKYKTDWCTRMADRALLITNEFAEFCKLNFAWFIWKINIIEKY
jgi:hypothetical protein